MCPHCDVAMVYHQAGEELRCHYCEHHEPIPTVCPKCNSKRIKFFGSGTQKVDEELRRHFKSARNARLDQVLGISQPHVGTMRQTRELQELRKSRRMGLIDHASNEVGPKLWDP